MLGKRLVGFQAKAVYFLQYRANKPGQFPRFTKQFCWTGENFTRDSTELFLCHQNICFQKEQHFKSQGRDIQQKTAIDGLFFKLYSRVQPIFRLGQKQFKLREQVLCSQRTAFLYLREKGNQKTEVHNISRLFWKKIIFSIPMHLCT